MDDGRQEEIHTPSGGCGSVESVGNQEVFDFTPSLFSIKEA